MFFIAFGNTFTLTNLTVARNRYMCIVLYMTIKATTIDRTLNKGIASNGHISLCSQALRLNKPQVSCFISSTGIVLPSVIRLHTSRFIIGSICTFVRQDTLAGTKHMTRVVGAAFIRHLHIVRADFSIVADNNVTISTSTVC